MAQELTEDQAREAIGDSAFAVSAIRYPWAQWTNGNWWKIQRGEDFSIETDNMRRALVMHAQRHSMKASVHRRGDSLIFRFTGNG